MRENLAGIEAFATLPKHIRIHMNWNCLAAIGLYDQLYCCW